jgi:hypothetical protein
MSATSFWSVFGFQDTDLDPAVVTKVAGVAPDIAYVRGDPGPNHRPRTWGTWQIQGHEAESADAAIASVLNRLDQNARASLRTLSLTPILMLYATVPRAIEDPTFDLTPVVLRDIASLDCTFIFSSYVEGEEDE